MKRIYLIILAFVSFCQIGNAQTPINNPTVYVTENGSNTGTGVGGWFAAPISSDHFVYNVYNGVYSGEITVWFAGGDYYTDFVFTNIPTNIRCIKMYGGWNPLAPINKRTLSDRDFDLYETRFHATGLDDVIRFNGVGYYYPTGAGTCVVDGITLTGDGTTSSYSALSLYYGDHIISQCKFEKFVSTTWLVWMETAKDEYTDEQKEGLRKAFETLLPSDADKLKYTVTTEAAAADALPVFLTQNEFMRRMKEMSAHQQGMSFYGNMPDSYNLVLNTNHPAIQALVDKTEGQEERMKQLIDIALLASGQLKGEALAKFVNRSVELL